MLIVRETPSAVAVIVTVDEVFSKLMLELTKPVDDTVTSAVFEDVQFTTFPVTAVPSLVFVAAVSCRVSSLSIVVVRAVISTVANSGSSVGAEHASTPITNAAGILLLIIVVSSNWLFHLCSLVTYPTATFIAWLTLEDFVYISNDRR